MNELELDDKFGVSKASAIGVVLSRRREIIKVSLSIFVERKARTVSENEEEAEVPRVLLGTEVRGKVGADPGPTNV